MGLPLTQRNFCTCAAGDLSRNVRCFIVFTCLASEEWENKTWCHYIVKYAVSEWMKWAMCISRGKSQKHKAQHKRLVRKWYIQCCTICIKFRSVKQHYVVLMDSNLWSKSIGLISTEFGVVVTSRITGGREGRKWDQAGTLRELQQYLCWCAAWRIRPEASTAQC